MLIGIRMCMYRRLKVKYLNLQDTKEDFYARKNSKSRGA